LKAKCLMLARQQATRHSVLTALFLLMAACAAHVHAHAHAHAHAQRLSVEPFDPQRLLHRVPIDAAANAAKKTVQASAPKPRTPPLEATPLAGMRLVGSVQKDGQFWGLLRVNGLIYPVRVGDRLGQDQGLVSAITLTGLVLRETAPGPAGKTTERLVSLALVSEP
jgi:type IV pilus assembly protein PilP